MFSSSSLKFPLVFSCNIFNMSIVCLASGRFLFFVPEDGSSIAPKCNNVEAFNDATKVAKLISGN